MMATSAPAERLAPLSVRTVRGLSWNAASMAATLALTLVRTVVLARLIEPREFGLIGMAMTALGAIAALTTLGLDTVYIISDRGPSSDDRPYLDTIWTADLLRRLLISLTLTLAAVPVARFYSEGDVTSLVLILAWLPLIQGLQNPAVATLRRQLAFGRVVALDITQNSAALGFALLFAIAFGPTAKAVAWSQIVATTLSAMLSYLVIAYRPQFRLDRPLLRCAWKNGKYVALTAVLTFVTTTLDTIYVGKLLGAPVLGVYVIAFTAATLPLNAINTITRSVFLSAYSEIRRERIELLSESVSTGLVLSTSLLLVCYIPLTIFGGRALVAAVGERWAAAAPIVPLVCGLAFFRGVASLLGGVLVGARESPREDSIPKIGEVCILAATLGPLTAAFGMRGAALAGLLTYCVAALWRFAFLQKGLPQAARTLARRVVRAAAACIPVVVLTTLVAQWLRPSSLVGLVLGGSAQALLLAGTLALVLPEVRQIVAPITRQFGGMYGNRVRS